MCTDDVCAMKNCGEGACKASNASVLGFDCECYSGWKKIQIGPLTFPYCGVPNCECLSPCLSQGVHVLIRMWSADDLFRFCAKIDNDNVYASK
jgi:hypothetical protein